MFFTEGGEFLQLPSGFQAGEKSPDTEIEPDRWYHAVATYEDPVGRLYLDGELKLEGEGKGGAIRYEGDVRTEFGGFRGKQQFFHGVIDEIAIWDRVLTPEEITELASPVTLWDKLTTTWGRIKNGSYWVSRSWEILRAFYASEACKNPDIVRDSRQPLDELVVWKT